MMWNKPAIWDELLKAAPKGSVLMGGAVRDFYWGYEAKDYDIFYSYKPGLPEIEGWKYVPKDDFPPDGPHPDYDIAALNGTNPIGCVYDYEVNYHGKVLKVQLVGVHYANPLDHFANFDHSLTLGIYDNQGMFLHKKLVHALENKEVELLNPANSPKSMARATSVIKRIDPYGALNWKYLNF